MGPNTTRDGDPGDATQRHRSLCDSWRSKGGVRRAHELPLELLVVASGPTSGCSQGGDVLLRLLEDGRWRWRLNVSHRAVRRFTRRNDHAEEPPTSPGR